MKLTETEKQIIISRRKLLEEQRLLKLKQEECSHSNAYRNGFQSSAWLYCPECKKEFQE